jgi:hypothetical protein
MSPKEVVQLIRAEPFQPVLVVTSSGDRYPIPHPELARLLPGGIMYIFQPTASDATTDERVVRVSCLHIASVEQLQTAA